MRTPTTVAFCAIAAFAQATYWNGTFRVDCQAKDILLLRLVTSWADKQGPETGELTRAVGNIAMSAAYLDRKAGRRRKGDR
jgi:hypothetical protein